MIILQKFDMHNQNGIRLNIPPFLIEKKFEKPYLDAEGNYYCKYADKKICALIMALDI